MKIVRLFAATLVATTLLTSCSKENDSDLVDKTPAVIQVKLSYGDTGGAATYAVDTPLEATKNTTLNNAILFQMVGNNVFLAKELTSADITAMTGVSGFRVENVNSTVNGVLIAGNIPTGEISKMKLLTTKAAIETYAIDVLNQQTSVTNAGVTNVTVIGFGSAIEKADPTPDGHKYKEANITAAPIVARMEVFGKVVSSSDPANQIKTITWKEVYFNRYYTTSKKDAMKEYISTDWSSIPTWAKDTYNGTATELKTKCYAYQFYPATASNAALLPMIVMKADVELNNGTTLANYYITIKTFKKNTTTITQMSPNTIYKVDLNNLTIDHTAFTPDPNPEQVDLGIKVTITPWTVENITPVI